MTTQFNKKNVQKLFNTQRALKYRRYPAVIAQILKLKITHCAKVHYIYETEVHVMRLIMKLFSRQAFD